VEQRRGLLSWRRHILHLGYPNFAEVSPPPPFSPFGSLLPMGRDGAMGYIPRGTRGRDEGRGRSFVSVFWNFVFGGNLGVDNRSGGKFVDARSVCAWPVRGNRSCEGVDFDRMDLYTTTRICGNRAKRSEGEIDRQADRQTDRQTDRQACPWREKKLDMGGYDGSHAVRQDRCRLCVIFFFQ
jgi:hypothetical protein